MIIWDYDNSEHIIKINGEEKVRLRAADFSLQGSNNQVERAFKIKADGLLDGYHVFFHIVDRATRNYVLCIAPTHLEPPENWWEYPPPPKEPQP